MLESEQKCQLCGEPMSESEQMFKFHGYSGPCPKPPIPRPAPEPAYTLSDLKAAEAAALREAVDLAAEKSAYTDILDTQIACDDLAAKFAALITPDRQSALDRAVSEAVQNAIADFHHNDAENYKLVEADFEREKNEQVSQAVAGMREAIAIEAINHDWFHIGAGIAKSIRQLPTSAADQGREQIEKDAFCNGVQSLLTEIQKVVPYWQEGRKVSDIVGQIVREARLDEHCTRRAALEAGERSET